MGSNNSIVLVLKAGGLDALAVGVGFNDSTTWQHLACLVHWSTALDVNSSIAWNPLESTVDTLTIGGLDTLAIGVKTKSNDLNAAGFKDSARGVAVFDLGLYV